MIVLDLSQEHQTGNSTLASTTATATTLSDLLHATGIFPENEESSLEGFENQTPRPPQQILLQPREVAGGERSSVIVCRANHRQRELIYYQKLTLS